MTRSVNYILSDNPERNQKYFTTHLTGCMLTAVEAHRMVSAGGRLAYNRAVFTYNRISSNNCRPPLLKRDVSGLASA